MKRSEEELMRAQEVARTILNEGKKKDGLRSLKVGRISIFSVAFLFLVAGSYLYSLNAEAIYLGIVGLFFLVYVALGVVFYRNPLVISSIALALFLLPHIISVVMDPRSLFNGILIKGLITAALISSIVNARRYQHLVVKKEKEENDILDREFL